MSLGSGYSFENQLEDMLYPTSKWESIKTAFITILTYPIVVLVIIPLSFAISIGIGYLSPSKFRECDCCKKLKLNNQYSSNNFDWFCSDCNKKYYKLTEDFKDRKGVVLK